MSKPKFTPESWTLSDCKSDYPRTFICAGGPVGTPMGEIESLLVCDCESRHRSLEECQANAALCVSSPKLYRAVEKALLGYRVLKTVLEKAGLNEGMKVAVEHIAEFEALLKEARGE